MNLNIISSLLGTTAFQLSLLFVALSCFNIQALEHSLVIVVNIDSSIQKLTKKQITDIYMGRYQSFPDGKPVSPIDFPTNSEEKKQFYMELVNQNEKRIESYWSRLLFSGRAKPPLKAFNSEQVADLVSESARSLAYLPENIVTDEMRIVYRF